tara:strand:+ start:740 stop:910 length:171 start_codon:yes stop_codon:yes gene_type:complete
MRTKEEMEFIKSPDGKKILAGINRRVRIIAWLLPRFHSGLSDPRKYQELIGRIDDA